MDQLSSESFMQSHGSVKSFTLINNDTSPVPPKVTIIHEERSEFSELYLLTRMFP